MCSNRHEKGSITRKDSEKEGERRVAEKKGMVRRQLPEKLISRGKEGAPAAWLSGTLPCSAGCRGARKRRMAMVRGAANGRPGETLFSKAIPSRFRRVTVEKAKGARKGIRRISRTEFPREETRLLRNCPGRALESIGSVGFNWA